MHIESIKHFGSILNFLKGIADVCTLCSPATTTTTTESRPANLERANFDDATRAKRKNNFTLPCFDHYDFWLNAPISAAKKGAEDG